MSADPVDNTGPSPSDFAGTSVADTAYRLFSATRPKFFPASALPVVAGTAWGYGVSAQFDALAFSLAMLATVCVHAGANVLNDVGDEQGGTDRCNDDRIYPYTGGSRFIQAGILTARNMARLGISLLAVAAVAGMLLLLLKGPVVLAFGFAGVLLAVLYSLGPVRLSSLGLGEIAVGIAFGVIPITGAAWLHSGVVDQSVVLFSLPISAWVTSILLINEVPDIKADGATGKRTLPVRLGLTNSAILYFSLQMLAVVVIFALAWTGELPLLAPLLPVVLLILAFKAAAAIRHGVEDRQRMTAGIEATLGIHTAGSIWLAGCVLFDAFWSL